MKLHHYLLISGSIFGFAALVQLIRIFTAATIEVAGLPVPMFPSYAALLVALVLAISAFRLFKSNK